MIRPSILLTSPTATVEVAASTPRKSVPLLGMDSRLIKWLHIRSLPGPYGCLMAHNAQRTAKMQTRTTAQLIALYKAMTLSSAAAGFELQQRGVPLPKRGPELEEA